MYSVGTCVYSVGTCVYSVGTCVYFVYCLCLLYVFYADMLMLLYLLCILIYNSSSTRFNIFSIMIFLFDVRIL